MKNSGVKTFSCRSHLDLKGYLLVQIPILLSVKDQVFYQENLELTNFIELGGTHHI